MDNQDLFQAELKVIENARNALERGHSETGPSSEEYERLLEKYIKLFKQTRRLIRFSDRMQNDLNRLNQQLCQSEAKYRNIFENATEGIFRTNPSGRLMEVNPAMARILEYPSPREMIRRPKGGHPLESQDGYRGFLDVIHRTGQCRQHQTELIQATGDVIWVEFNAQPSFDESGRMTHIDGLLSDITEKRYLQEELTRLAHTDALTGIFNRRRFTEILEQTIRRARRRNTALSLLMLDIDFFKSVNDSYGHDMGDRVLQRLTAVCRKELRRDDVFGRLGGEEFAVILPAAGRAEAARIAERLCHVVEREEICAGSATVRITVSIGLSELGGAITSLETLLKTADEALYRAKQEGRNQVCVHASASGAPIPAAV